MMLFTPLQLLREWEVSFLSRREGKARAYPVPSGLTPAWIPNSGTSAGFTSRRVKGSEWTEAAMAAAVRAAVMNFMMLIGGVLRSVGKVVQMNSRVVNGERGALRR